MGMASAPGIQQGTKPASAASRKKPTMLQGLRLTLVAPQRRWDREARNMCARDTNLSRGGSILGADDEDCERWC